MPSIKIYKTLDVFSSRNVIDEYKSLSNEEIKEKINENSLPFAVLMFQLVGDFNFGSVIRSSNALGAREVFYFGERKYDRRGTVGCHNYSQPIYLKSYKELLDLKSKYSFVALEQSDRSVDLAKFNWQTRLPPCILVGEEGCGLSNDIINLCDYCVEIKQRGSIRSLNAASAFTVCAYDFASKYLA